MNTMSETFGGIDVSAVDEFQHQHSIVLSETYRQFLVEFNGGKPRDGEFAVPGWGSTIIQRFYGLHTGNAYDLEDAWDRVNDHEENEVLPIASDPGGWQIFLVVRGPYAGALYFVDHKDYESEPIRIGESFEAFFHGLHPDGSFGGDGNLTVLAR